MAVVTARLAASEATPSLLAGLLRLVAGRRSVAARITTEIADAQRRMNTLLYRRVPGEMIDAIEDEILVLRAQLMVNDVAMMDLVEQARRANEHRSERLDLEAAFRAMPGTGDDHRTRAAPGS